MRGPSFTAVIERSDTLMIFTLRSFVSHFNFIFVCVFSLAHGFVEALEKRLLFISRIIGNGCYCADFLTPLHLV